MTYLIHDVASEPKGKKMSKTEERADKLMAFLLKNKDDRGMMADLRCGFSEAKAHRCWPHVAQLCDLEKEWSRIPVQTVCAAFATHSESAGAGNTGTTLREIAQGNGKDGLASFEGRFRRLLTCDTLQELCERLPSVIRVAKAKGVPVNYRQLYCDICRWEKWDIKIRWAAAYWGTTRGAE
jgi:CRISPR system Cascade subunit CasB